MIWTIVKFNYPTSDLTGAPLSLHWCCPFEYHFHGLSSYRANRLSFCLSTHSNRTSLALALALAHPFQRCDRPRCTLTEGWIELINILEFTNNFIGAHLLNGILCSIITSFSINLFMKFVYFILLSQSLLFCLSLFPFKFYGRLESWRDATNSFFYSSLCSLLFFRPCLSRCEPKRNETLSDTHTHTHTYVCEHMGYLLISEIIFVTMKNWNET